MLLHVVTITTYWRHSVFAYLQCLLFLVCVNLEHTAHLQQLNWCIKKRQTLLRPTVQNVASKQPADLNPVDCEIWAVMQRRVYHKQIHSVDDLKRRLIAVWCGLQQSIFDKAIDQRQKTSSVCPY